jgi:hypothetical protein
MDRPKQKPKKMKKKKKKKQKPKKKKKKKLLVIGVGRAMHGSSAVEKPTWPQPTTSKKAERLDMILLVNCHTLRRTSDADRYR